MMTGRQSERADDYSKLNVPSFDSLLVVFTNKEGEFNEFSNPSHLKYLVFYTRALLGYRILLEGRSLGRKEKWQGHNLFVSMCIKV
jgi:hypothetical protein